MSHDYPEKFLGSGLASEHLFAGLSPEAVRELGGLHGTQHYPAGMVLFQEGEPAEGIFVLCRGGGVKLSVCSSHGEKLTLRQARAGEALGVSAVLSGTAHEVTAETSEPSDLIFIKRKDFLRYLREHKDACLRVVESLSNDVHAAYDRVRSLGLSRIRHSHN
jgi:CRP/FNR family transcriptional regulator, cyclic AMP receptor protein